MRHHDTIARLEVLPQDLPAVIEHREAIVARIKALAHNWEFDRVARIDRNILRLAIFEMLYRKDIPPVVSINEAIDLSKQFSNSDSKRFINGILDRIHKERAPAP